MAKAADRAPKTTTDRRVERPPTLRGTKGRRPTATPQAAWGGGPATRHPKRDPMYLTRTIGRWQIELHQRAIHITRHPKPDPNCPSCHGRGGHGYITPDGDADWEDCHCLSWLRTWSIRLWPRRNPAKEYPF